MGESVVTLKSTLLRGEVDTLKASFVTKMQVTGSGSASTFDLSSSGKTLITPLEALSKRT